MSINIAQKDRNFIYGIIGFPNINIEDTGIMDDQILDDMIIEPSLMEYYRFFPIEEINQTQITSGNTSVEIDWPADTIDTFVYDVKDCRLANLMDTNIVANGADITNPIVQFRSISRSYSSGRLGSRFNYGFSEIQGSENFGNDSRLNQNNVFYNKTDHVNKKVKIYSQNPGVVQTTFARYSTDVDKIRWTSKREFLDLCRGELLLYWSNSLKRINSEFPVSFDTDQLDSDGQELVDKTLDKWRGKTKAVMMRG